MVDWKKINPSIKITHTNKAVYGGHTHKLTICAPGIQYIAFDPADPYTSDKFKKQCDRAKILLANKRFQFGYRSPNGMGVFDYELMMKLNQILALAKLKVRQESYFVTFYATNDQDLLDLVNEYSLQKNITKISRPASEKNYNELLEGKIIRKVQNGYKHKIILRRSIQTAETKQQILDYLDSFEENEVLITHGTRWRLSSANSRYVRGDIYVSDPNITTFLILMAPKLVNRVVELAEFDDKNPQPNRIQL